MQISSKPEGAELFSDPLDSTYLLHKIFTMPSTQGGYRGVSLTDRESFYLASGYALLIAAIFGSLWQFATYFALVFYPTEERRTIQQMLSRNNVPIEDKKNNDFINYYKNSTPQDPELLKVRQRKANRYIALVAIWNSSDPYTAMALLIKHFSLVFRVDKQAGCFDIIMIFIALVLVAGGIFAGIVVPANLEMGNVAPVNPQSIFFPSPNMSEPAQVMAAQQVRGGAAQRAVGVVEYAKNQLRERVTLSPDLYSSYEFNVTGVDFGLQLRDAADFTLRTQGGCILNHGAYDVTGSDNTTDVYNLYGATYAIYTNSAAMSMSAGGRMVMPGLNNVNDLYNSTNGGNMSYTIIPDTVGRYSQSVGTDPWYLTEPTPPLDVELGFPTYVISRGRPPLSCWQKDEWSYRGKTVNLNQLEELGIDLPTVILINLFRDRFTYPMTYDIGVALGSSILLMSASSAGGILNAQSGFLKNDFERLILGAYVSTQDVFRDSTMSQYSPSLGIANSAFDDSGKPREGVGKFVISSTKVKAVSLRVLVSVPVIWAFLYLVLLATRCTRFTNRNSGKVSRFTLRATALQAMQLYRMLDEEKCGDRDDWHGRLEDMPYILEAKEARERSQNQSGTTKSQDGNDSEKISVVGKGSTTETAATGPRPYLFIAPKVIGTGPEESRRHHLSFVGPVEYQSRTKESRFSFKGKGAPPIVNGPAKPVNNETAKVLSDAKEPVVKTEAMRE